MSSSLPEFTEQMKKNGSLALLANLLFDTVFIGWIAFAGLYLIEVLLPTFITARISLVKLALVLFAFTVALSAIGAVLPEEKKSSRHPQTKWALGLIIPFVFLSLAIAHYRFPWWAIPLCLGGYATTSYLLWKNHSSN